MKTCLSCEGIASTEARRCSACGGPLLSTTEVHYPLRRGEEDSAHPMLGVVVDGTYRVAAVLGRGGMGTVFRAVHEVSLVPVALKLLHPRFALRPEYRARFLAEARKAGRVVDEHTARILDVGETADGSIYIAQELVAGSTLHDWLHATCLPSPAAVVEVLVQICGALAAAHAAGLVHRDLTPRNVMVDVRDGRPFVKVLDFGIARGATERFGGGEEGVDVFASPPYAAPEHLEGGDVDGRADLYSLGVIAFEALTGQLPTAGTSAAEHAAATLRGELRELRASRRVPVPLARLVRRLLSRRPADRPATAQGVQGELESIQQSERGVLPVLALTALFVAIAMFAWTHRGVAGPAYLRLAQGYELRLLAAPGSDADVQDLQSRQLARLRFDYGEFDPQALAVELSQQGEVIARRDLRPDVDEQALTLHTGQDGYASLLNAVRLFSQQGPVHLKFLVPGQPPLCYAAVRLDDDPPRVEFAIDADLAGVVHGASRLRLQAKDAALASVSLQIEHAGGVRQRAFALPLPGGDATAAQILAASLPGTRPYRGVSLRLVASDRAGNEASSEPVVCSIVDLGVPTILGVHGQRSEPRSLFVGPDGIRLRVELSETEPELEAWLRPRGGEFTRCTDMVALERSLDVTWPWDAAAGVPAAGSYEFEIRDPVGNVARFAEAFTFATAQPDVSLATDPGASGGTLCAAVVGGRVLGDGRPFELLLRCNPIYEAFLVELTAESSAAGATHGAGEVVLRGASGEGRMQIPALEGGRYTLAVHLREGPDGLRVVASFELLVRPEPFVLRVPDARHARHLAQLVESGMLTMRDGLLAEGSAWQFEPSDDRWLRGRCWTGFGELGPRDLVPRQRPGDTLFRPWAPRRGENVLHVSLRDALGRPVVVLAGDQPARRVPSPSHGSDEIVSELARFVWHDQAPVLREPDIRVEYGQSARLLLDAALPYSDADLIELLLDATPIRPRALSARGDSGGVTLEFVLPFERLLAAARLGPLTPAEFAAGRTSEPFTVTLVAPDGRHSYETRVLTQRTVLEAVQLGDIPGAALPASLMGISMLPILGPGLGQVWPDPVPDGVRDREAFRPLPHLDVRNVTDCYLQADECTRRQYADICREIQAAAGAGRPVPYAALVHFGDPLGAARLTREGMVPAAMRGDLAAWQAAVEAGPERAVAGVDFFQAFAAVRALAWLRFDDPDVLRLPAGVELEVAALAAARELGAAPALHGAARSGGVKRLPAQRAQREIGDAARWPLRADELIDMGDVVRTELGGVATGLDFGVREWVIDLPLLARETSRPLLIERLSDHQRHVAACMGLAAGDAAAGLDAELVRIGSARGVAVGEAQLAGAGARALIEAACPGAVRVLQLRRDGRGVLAEEFDPHLAFIGFRICGSQRFLDRVRAR